MDNNLKAHRSHISALRNAAITCAAALTLWGLWAAIDHLGAMSKLKRSIVRTQCVLTELQLISSNLESAEAEQNARLMFGASPLLTETSKVDASIISSTEQIKKFSRSDEDTAEARQLQSLCDSWLKKGSTGNASRVLRQFLNKMDQEKQLSLKLNMTQSDEISKSFMEAIIIVCVASVLDFTLVIWIAATAAAERRRTKEDYLRLVLEKELTRNIIACAPNGFAKFDSDFNLLETNSTFLLHSRVESLSNTSLFDVMNVPRITEALRSAICSGHSYCAENVKLQYPSQCIYLSINAWPLYDSVGDPVGGFVITSDVTERVCLEGLRDDVFATIAHDLKVPLIGMDRILQLFLAGRMGQLDASQHTTLAKLRQSNDALLNLVQRLVDVHKYDVAPETLEMAPVNVVDKLQEAINLIIPLAEKKNLHIVQRVPEMLELFGDSISILRLLTNLLDNAVKFTPHNGTIDVTLTHADRVFILEVSNPGDDLSSEITEKLFQRFYQGIPGRRHSAGTGLGLYMCRKIVEAHQGTIECISRSGMITFRTVLPLLARTDLKKLPGPEPELATAS